MLSDARHYSAPFPFFTSDEALPPAALARLRALFDAPLAWTPHDSFYKAYISVVSERVDPELQRALLQRMRALTGSPLVAPLQITAQRMAPGQYAGPHTDRPLLGYEAARLILQLNPSWRPGDGGALRLHEARDAPPFYAEAPALTRPPLDNSAFGFVMGPRSFHSVTPTRVLRRTVVFNFWHAGNSEALAEAVRGLFAEMRFGDLPASLDAAMAAAEAQLPDEDSHRAASVAWLLGRWGAGEGLQAAGFEAGLRPLRLQETRASLEDAVPSARAALVWLARWAHHLHTEGFDPSLWAALAPGMAAVAPPQPLAALAFPAHP